MTEAEGLDAESSVELAGASAGVAPSSLGDSALDPLAAGAWAGVSVLAAGALAGAAFGVAEGELVGAFSSFPWAEAGAFDGAADEPEAFDDFGEAAGAGASAASATTADTARRAVKRPRV
jgi:hypothetical protein